MKPYFHYVVLFSLISLISVKFNIAQDKIIFSSAPTAPPLFYNKLSAINDLMTIDIDCLSPCWWGLTLGQTPTGNWKSFLEKKFNESLFLTPLSSNRSEFSMNIDTWGIRLIQDAKKIFKLSISYETPQDKSKLENFHVSYFINSLFRAYGIPNEIFISASLNYWSITIEYKNPSLLVHYLFPTQTPLENNEISMCLVPDTLWYFQLQAVAENSQEVLNLPYGEMEIVKTIEEISEFTIQEFVRYSLTNPNVCLNTPADIWIGN